MQRSLLSYIHAFRRPKYSYENLLLDYKLAIEDERGHLARLSREQRVQFLTSEAGVVRDLVWGDGNQTVGYRASGAKPVERRREGMTQVVWLGLPERPVAGQEATVRSSRTVVDALTKRDEFLEVRVERPTRRLRLSVVFPSARPPTSAMVDAIPADSIPRRPLTLRLQRDRRAIVTWNSREVRPFTTYRIRWTW